MRVRHCHSVSSAALLLVSSCFLSACGGDDGESTGSGGAGLQAQAEELGGIYEVTSMTRNEMACDAEGSPPADVTDTHLYLVGDQVFGIPYVKVDSCAGVADCQAQNQQRINLEIYQTDFAYSFGASPGAGQLTGEIAGTGFSGGPLCERPSLETITLTSDGAGNITIESRTSIGDDYPPDADGFCTTDLGRAASVGKPCSELEVVKARFLQKL